MWVKGNALIVLYKLTVIQLRVKAAFFYEFGVSALLDYVAVAHNEYYVGVNYSG